MANTREGLELSVRLILRARHAGGSDGYELTASSSYPSSFWGRLHSVQAEGWSVKVVCIADIHGRLPYDLPPCDVLVLAGDICPDIQNVGWDPSLMRAGQEEWLDREYRSWEATVPAKHILATGGNHDWIVGVPAGIRTKFVIDEAVEINGKTFWLTPWVSYCGHWNYQMDAEGRRQRYADIPYRADLLVSHGPPYGCGDLPYGSDMPVGCRELRAAIQKKQPRHVVFGHIHEGQRYGREFRLGGSKCYHASMWGQNWKPVELEI